ncbi:MAG: hypothetical protein IPP13_15635 [Kouleothrix sp.]|nr:hypothetical protein [Kouleothrix sp.]
MHRVIVLLVLCAFVLAGCGGSTGDTSVPDPPKSSAFEPGGSAQVDTIIAQWQEQVPVVLGQYLIKPDTIEKKVYQSSASLQEIADFYAGQITSAKGWVEVQRMPGQQAGLFMKAYDHGNVSLVIGALDASKLGGTGTVIYTAKGSK